MVSLLEVLTVPLHGRWTGIGSRCFDILVVLPLQNCASEVDLFFNRLSFHNRSASSVTGDPAFESVHRIGLHGSFGASCSPAW